MGKTRVLGKDFSPFWKKGGEVVRSQNNETGKAKGQLPQRVEGENDNWFDSTMCEHVESWNDFINKAIRILGRLASGKINVSSTPASFSH